MTREKENLQINGVDVEENKYFKAFFDRYAEYFGLNEEIIVEKIEARPLLKG